MERERLVTGLVAGDQAAWRSFVEEYGTLIYAVGAKLGLEAPDRDDLFQETCLTALRSIQTLRSPAKLASWIYTIAYRLGIDAHRRKRSEVLLDNPGGLVDSSTPQGAEPAFAAGIERLEAVAHLLDAMARLDARCRRLLTALFLEDPRPSYMEIGTRLGIPVGSIGPTRARCLRKAGKLLEGGIK